MLREYSEKECFFKDMKVKASATLQYTGFIRSYTNNLPYNTSELGLGKNLLCRFQLKLSAGPWNWRQFLGYGSLYMFTIPH